MLGQVHTVHTLHTLHTLRRVSAVEPCSLRCNSAQTRYIIVQTIDQHTIENRNSLISA